jgi:hypothetical protein
MWALPIPPSPIWAMRSLSLGAALLYNEGRMAKPAAPIPTVLINFLRLKWLLIQVFLEMREMKTYLNLRKKCLGSFLFVIILFFPDSAGVYA